MDNLTHMLAGAVLARAGLGRRTPLAMPTLLLAANLPDLDVLAYLRDPLFALTFRRGWTHGVLAMAVLPLALAGGMAAWDRLVRRRRRPDGAPAPFRELLLLSFAGVLSHPLLDLLNTYGVRLLMPFSGRWFYGDTLFIVDPWLWGLLGLAWALPVVESRRDGARPSGNGRARSGRIVGGLAVLYIGMMFGLGRFATAASARGVAALGLDPDRLMASPVPLHPLRRSVLVDLGDSYRWGSYAWGQSGFMLAAGSIPKNLERPEIAPLLERPEARAFLGWSRFPAAVWAPAGVRLYDLRYAGGETDSWASVVITPR
jgi:inner membrane protein